MTSNDVVLLNDMIERSRTETAGLSPSEQETYFVAKHYLRAYRPSHDDLLAGLVDGSGDGGIDSIHLFANGHCVRDDSDLSALGRNAQLDLIVLQVKNTRGFGESAIDKLIVNLPALLDFARDEQQLGRRFNGKVIEVSRRFLSAYRTLIMPDLSVYCGFASLKADNLHPNTKERGEHLGQTVKRCFGSANPVVHFLDAAQVADMARDRPPSTHELALAENPISTDMSGGYLGIVRLDQYQDFITDATGKLDASLFEANVRDYEGEDGVNHHIQETLNARNETIDFWWLNNGVTIVADKVQLAGKLLSLESPQVVNGLQTSHEIFKRRIPQDGADKRGVLVKVIQVADDTAKDRIIRATNSQTNLGLSSLKATDKVQRQIEEHLKSAGLFYERRKNFYQNRNIPIADLVSIDQMGQAVMATLVQVPHLSRGEATRIFADDVYDEVFTENHPVAMYLNAIRIVRRCEQFLRSRTAYRGQTEDFLFYLAMLATVSTTLKASPKPRDIAAASPMPDDRALTALMAIVQEEFEHVARGTGEVLFERLAKSEQLSDRLRERCRQVATRVRRSG